MSTSNSTVYGGDEINAIVLDPGSYHTRIGYAGDDFPKIITPSYYGYFGEDTTNEATTKTTSENHSATTDDGTATAIGDNDNEKSTAIGKTSGKTTRSKTVIFGDSIDVPRPNFHVKPILKDSVIVDWDSAIQQYEHYFDTVLKVQYGEQPILITEPIWSEPKYRQQLVERFYETFKFPALYLAKTPTCVSFQQGRPNCLIVDVGHDCVSITPVVDGISLLKHSVRTHYGGQFLADQIEDLVVSKSVIVEPTFNVKTKTPTIFPQEPIYTTRLTKPTESHQFTQSFYEYQKQRIWHEFKETVLEVPDKSLVAPNVQQQAQLKEFYNQDSHKRLFEFPTGQSLELGLERYQIAESIFDPSLAKFTQDKYKEKYPHENGQLTLHTNYEEYRPIKRRKNDVSAQSTPLLADATTTSTSTAAPKSKSSNVRGLAQLITYTLLTIDIDLRASIAHNIIVTGGVSLMTQLTERLYNELSNTNPGLKIRLHAVGNSTERMNQAWIGGSVLASLGTFHQMWVTREEWDEVGADRILNQRFR
jgi:actin-related protein 4